MLNERAVTHASTVSHGSRFVGVFGAHTDFALWVFLGLTRISQIPPFLLWVENLTEALRFVAFCGLTQIQRDSTRRLFVEICVNLWL